MQTLFKKTEEWLDWLLDKLWFGENDVPISEKTNYNLTNKNMWTAEIKTVEVFKGLVSASVRFSKGEDYFDESISTDSKENLEGAVSSKLEKLNKLYEDMPTTGVIGAKQQLPLAKEEYRTRLERFNKIASVIQLGFTTEELAEFQTLKTYLKDNFSTDYLDLF